MKKIQKALVAPAIATMALGLVACGSDDTTGGSSSASTSASSSESKSSDCPEGNVTVQAEGSSAQKNAFEKVTADYQKQCPNVTVNYNATGSGTGIKQFIAKQADFAGSDSALKESKDEPALAKERCGGNDAWNIPMVTGPIAVAYNAPGKDGIVLTADVIAKVFSGQITKWNDPAIAAANEGVELPDADIKVFYRSDDSGTTDNFQSYLEAAAKETWGDKGAGKKFNGGVGEGREKSAGVAKGVKEVEGGITYVEWSYAKDNELQIAKVDNGGGAVELNSETVGKAVSTAERAGQGNDLKLKLDYATKTPGAYPVILVTYEIVCSKGLDANKTEGVKSFLKYFASEEAQKSIEGIGYAPLPAEVEKDVETAIDAIQ